MQKISKEKNTTFKVKKIKNILSILIVVSLVLTSFTTVFGKNFPVSEKNMLSEDDFEGDIQISDESKSDQDSPTFRLNTFNFVQKLIDSFPNLAKFPLVNRLLEKDAENQKLEKIKNAVMEKLDEKPKLFSSRRGSSTNAEDIDDSYKNAETQNNPLEETGLNLGILSDGGGEATIVPNAGHISIMGSGELTIDTILNINDSFIVTLQGSLYMDTNMESIDIWWNLSSGYFEINADALSNEGEPFELHDFLIDIRENNSDPAVLTINVGFFSADAGGHILIENNMAIGNLNINGVFQIQDINVSATNLPFGNLTMAASLNCYGEIGTDNLTVSWNETTISVDGSVLVDGALSIEVRDFYINVADLGTLKFDTLDIYGDIFLFVNALEFNSSDIPGTSYYDIIFEVNGNLTMTNILGVIQGSPLEASLVDAEVSLIFVSRDSGEYTHIEGEGYLEVCDFAFSTMISFKRFYIEGQAEFTQTPSYLYFYLDANARVEYFHLSVQGIFVEFDLLTADVYVILETSPQSFKITAGGYVAVKTLYASVSGITVSMKCGYIGGNGYIWFHGGTIDAHATFFLATTQTHITGMGHSVYWSLLTADASVDLHIGGYIEASLGLNLLITDFNLDGSLYWTTLSLSAAGTLFIGGNTVEFSGGGVLYIAGGHFGSYVDYITGTFGLNAAGTATFENNGGAIHFSGSAGAYISGLTFRGSGIDLSLGSFTLDLGGSGTFVPKSNGFELDATAALSVSSLVVNSPLEINIPSLTFDIAGGVDVTVAGVSAHFVANGKLDTGYISVSGQLIQLNLDGTVSADIDFGSLSATLSGSGTLHAHYEKSSGSTFDIDLNSFSGSANINLGSLDLQNGYFDVSTGGGSLDVDVFTSDAIIAGINDISLSASGNIQGLWSASGSTFSADVSGDASLSLSLKDNGAEKLSISGDIESAHASVILQKGSGDFPLVPPDYCNINIGFTGNLDFTLAGAVKFSISDSSGSLLWDKFAPPGERLSISGDLNGNLYWWESEWVQLIPWPWAEGDVTLKAKDKNGVWQTGSAEVEPGWVDFLATVNLEDTGNNDYTYEFFWGDGSPGVTKTSNENCVANHEYTGFGSYNAEVKVYQDNWLIGIAQVTIQIGQIDVTLSSNKNIYTQGETATYIATVKTDDSSGGSNSNNENNNYESFASNAFSYTYDFDFGDGDTANRGPTGKSVQVSDTCDEVSGLFSNIFITVSVTEVDSAGNPTGRQGSASCSIKVLGGLVVTLRASKNLPEVGEEVQFTAKVVKDDSSSSSSEQDNSESNSYASLGGEYTYDFSFGDGAGVSNGPTTSRTVTESHAYEESGPRLVTVTVVNTETGAQGTGYAAVLVTGGLSVTLTASPKTPAVEESVTFTAKVSEDNSNSNNHNSENNNYASFVGSDYEYVFEFRDGSSTTINSGNVASTSHAYLESGTYVAKVSVYGDEISGAAQTTVYVGGGNIVCTPEHLDFGTIDPGDSKTLSFTVTNNGQEAISWSSTSGGSDISRSPGSGSLSTGGSTSVSVTVTAPEGGSNSNSESNSQESQEAESTVYSSLSFETYTTSFESEEQQQTNAATPIGGGTNNHETSIKVYNTADPTNDFDTVVISYKTKKSSPVADAGMAMSISQAQTGVTYQTVPQTFISPQGQPYAIDDSYSFNIDPQGNYDVQQYGTTVVEDLGSPEDVQNYAATGTVPDNDDEDGDDDSDDDNSDDDNSDDSDDDNSDDDNSDDSDDDNSDSDEEDDESDDVMPLNFAGILDYDGKEDNDDSSAGVDESGVSVQFNGVGSILSLVDTSGYHSSSQTNVFPLGSGPFDFYLVDSIPVANIHEGDKVVSGIGSSTLYTTTNPEVFTKTAHYRCTVDYVTISIELEYLGLVAIDIETGEIIGPDMEFTSEFSVTSDYLVCVNGNYIKASKVKAGDILYNINGDDGYDMVVKSVEHNHGFVQAVYDLTLAGFGGFFVNGGLVKSPGNYGEVDSCSGVLYNSNIYVPFNNSVVSQENTLSLSSKNQQSFSLYNKESSLLKLSSVSNAIENLILILLEKFPMLENIPFIQRIVESHESGDVDETDENTDVSDDDEIDTDDGQDNDNGDDVADDDGGVVDDGQDDTDDSSSDGDNTDVSDDDQTDTDDGQDDQIDEYAEEISYDDIDVHSVKFIWDFGDGNVGFGLNPVHTYDVAQTLNEDPFSSVADQVTYNAILLITDENGNVISSDTITVTIQVDGMSYSYSFSSSNLNF